MDGSGECQKRFELIKALVLLPGTMLVIIPGLILYITKSANVLGGLECPVAFLPLVLGVFFLSAGLIGAARAVDLFMRVGDGTPAPWAPPRTLVVIGLYAYVRNPMMLSAIFILIGEAIVTCSLPILVWAFIFWAVNTFYFIYFEEPVLRRRFGRNYEEYSRHVGRWVPRIVPWKYREEGF